MPARPFCVLELMLPRDILLGYAEEIADRRDIQVDTGGVA
jgi:hypothetical protein